MCPVELPEEYPVVPNEAPPVLRLTPPRVSKRSTVASASVFGLRGDLRVGAVRVDARTVDYSEGSVHHRLFRASGGIQHRDVSRWMRGDPHRSFEVSNREAVRLAQQIARAVPEVSGRTEGPAVVKRLHVASSSKDGKSRSDSVTHVAVQFRRAERGIPVEGPGGMVTLFVHPDGHSSGFDLLWRPVSKVFRESLDLVDARDVVERVIRDWWRRGLRTGRVTRVRFGYLELDWTANQRLLQPAYVVFGLFQDPSGKTRFGRIEAVHASASPAGPLLPPRPRLERAFPERHDASGHVATRTKP